MKRYSLPSAAVKLAGALGTLHTNNRLAPFPSAPTTELETDAAIEQQRKHLLQSATGTAKPASKYVVKRHTEVAR
jgi:hypothetical protein